jgi:hypothetical protein
MPVIAARAITTRVNHNQDGGKGLFGLSVADEDIHSCEAGTG